MKLTQFVISILYENDKDRRAAFKKIKPMFAIKHKKIMRIILKKFVNK